MPLVATLKLYNTILGSTFMLPETLIDTAATDKAR
jgi:hypothetical protein